MAFYRVVSAITLGSRVYSPGSVFTFSDSEYKRESLPRSTRGFMRRVVQDGFDAVEKVDGRDSDVQEAVVNLPGQNVAQTNPASSSEEQEKEREVVRKPDSEPREYEFEAVVREEEAGSESSGSKE